MSTHPTYCFIINCASNSSKAESFFRSKQDLIKQSFPNSEFVYVGRQDSISTIVKQKTGKYTHIIACGGDGTVSQAAHGVVGTNCILGVLPMGSGNDFAQSSGIPLSIDRALATLKAGHIKSIDVIKYDNGIFVNTCGIGLDGLTNWYASNSTHENGLMRYFTAGLKAMYKAEPFTTTIVIPELNHRIKQKVWMVVVANGATEGGRYKISPSSVNSDGQAELIVVKDISRLRLFLEFIKLSVGLPFNKYVVDSYSFSKSFKIEYESSKKVHMDGENVKLGENKAMFELEKNAIRVLVS